MFVEVDNAGMEEMTLSDATKVLKREVRKVEEESQNSFKEVSEQLV